MYVCILMLRIVICTKVPVETVYEEVMYSV